MTTASDDNFWSDSLYVVASDSMPSSVEGPKPFIEALQGHLVSCDFNILGAHCSDEGTPRINSRKQLIIDCGADASLVSAIEEFMTAADVKFVRHGSIQSGHIDVSYDLENVPVWRARS